MDYNRLFSDDVHSFISSPVKEITKNIKIDEIYSFAGGYPNSKTFPINEIKELNSYVLDHYGTMPLQYGKTQGVPELIEALSTRYGVKSENIQITTSSQQGIDICARVLLNPGDVVLVTNPTYFGAFQSFKSYQANIVALNSFTENTCGVSEEVLRKAKFCYIIADFQNPSGETLSLEERYELIELSRKYGFVIVEDGPYRELRFEGEALPTIYSLAPERVLHLGSFSKIFAPGFRLGWIFGPNELLSKIFICKQALDLIPPIFSQYVAAEYIKQGILDRVLPRINDFYRKRRDFLLALLEKYMPKGVTWTRPMGGFFLFLYLPQGFDSVAVYDEAISCGVTYVPGNSCYVDGRCRNTMRLNFTFLAEEKMERGVQLLAEVIGRNMPKIYKYSGAGNDFVVLAEEFEGQRDLYRRADVINALCDRKVGFVAADGRVGADGLMILTRSTKVDFGMDYYNSDGSGGMMCGNGGRCIVAFADELGFVPANGKYFVFEAADGLHTGEILNREGTKIVKIKMIDAFGLRSVLGGYFVNTGTRHFVKFVEDVDSVDVALEGRKLRYASEFAPEGANVNFVQVLGDGSLKLRTYEKGVEDETLACGTGIVAAAIASSRSDGPCRISVEARSSDILSVDFEPCEGGAASVYLTGPAEIIV